MHMHVHEHTRKLICAHTAMQADRQTSSINTSTHPEINYFVTSLFRMCAAIHNHWSMVGKVRVIRVYTKKLIKSNEVLIVKFLTPKTLKDLYIMLYVFD